MRTVSYVDALSGQTVGVIKVDHNPHEVAVTADGSISYVTNSGGPADGQTLYVANQHDNNLRVIDLESYEVVANLRLGTCPIRLTLTPDGRYALIPNRESNDLSIIDTASPQKIKRIPTGV